jgi:hypothetical protein
MSDLFLSLWIGVKIPVLKTFGIFPDCMILLNNFTMLGTILSPAYLKCSAVSVHPSEVLPVFNFPMER